MVDLLDLSNVRTLSSRIEGHRRLHARAISETVTEKQLSTFETSHTLTERPSGDNERTPQNRVPRCVDCRPVHCAVQTCVCLDDCRGPCAVTTQQGLKTGTGDRVWWSRSVPVNQRLCVFISVSVWRCVGGCFAVCLSGCGSAISHRILSPERLSFPTENHWRSHTFKVVFPDALPVKCSRYFHIYRRDRADLSDLSDLSDSV